MFSLNGRRAQTLGRAGLVKGRGGGRSGDLVGEFLEPGDSLDGEGVGAVGFAVPVSAAIEVGLPSCAGRGVVIPHPVMG